MCEVFYLLWLLSPGWANSACSMPEFSGCVDSTTQFLAPQHTVSDLHLNFINHLLTSNGLFYQEQLDWIQFHNGVSMLHTFYNSPTYKGKCLGWDTRLVIGRAKTPLSSNVWTVKPRFLFIHPIKHLWSTRGNNETSLIIPLFSLFLFNFKDARQTSLVNSQTKAGRQHFVSFRKN